MSDLESVEKGGGGPLGRPAWQVKRAGGSRPSRLISTHFLDVRLGLLIDALRTEEPVRFHP